MVQDTVDRPTYSVELTDAAIAKVMSLLRQEEAGLALQVALQPGGCTGMRYQLFFTDKYAKALAKTLTEWENGGVTEEDDPEAAAQRVALAADEMSVVWFGRFAVVIDPLSGPCLEGALIDYQDTPQKSGFTIANPDAWSSCGCGDPFQ